MSKHERNIEATDASQDENTSRPHGGPIPPFYFVGCASGTPLSQKAGAKTAATRFARRGTTVSFDRSAVAIEKSKRGGES
jgi:hypothetical protein